MRAHFRLRPWLTPIALTATALCLGCMSIIPSLAPTVEAEKDISTRFPYRSKYANVLASRLHYVEVGKGAPIVLLHGNPTSTYLWRNVIPHLAKRGRVIAVDLIGMGKSGKPDISYRLNDHVRYFDEFMTKLGLKDVTLVLHDWGGGVGLDHAMRNEKNIRGVAFMEAVVKPFKWDELSWPEAHLFRTMRSPDGEALMMDENYFVEKLVPAFAGRELDGEEMDAYRAPYKKRAHRKPTRVWPQEVPFDDGEPADNHKRISATYGKLKASKVPLLLLLATPGAIMTPGTVKQLTVDLPRMATESIGPGLHYVQETQPTRIGKALDKWIGTLPPWKGATP